jgi:hypothetical protein
VSNAKVPPCQRADAATGEKSATDFEALLEEFQEYPGKKNIEKIYSLENKINTPQVYFKYIACILDFLKHDNEAGILFFITKRHKRLQSEINNLIRKYEAEIAAGKDACSVICNISNKYIQFKKTMIKHDIPLKKDNHNREKEQEVKFLQDSLLRITEKTLIEKINK